MLADSSCGSAGRLASAPARVLAAGERAGGPGSVATSGTDAVVLVAGGLPGPFLKREGALARGVGSAETGAPRHLAKILLPPLPCRIACGAEERGGEPA